MSSTLDAVRAVEGKGLDELEHQLQQSRDIFASMQDNLKADILQNLISVVLGCDNDGDMMLSDEEINNIILKLEGMNGVDLKEDLLREALVQNGRSLNGMNVIVNAAAVCDEKVKERYTIVLNMYSHSSFHCIAILDVARNLLDDNVPPEENVFIVKKEE